MEDIILQTKLHVPPLRPSLVSRPYLIAKLNSGLSGKLTLVSAPAGFGKTTLIVDWIAQLQHSKEAAPHACWLSLDADDNVLARFFAYLIKALQTVDDRWGETVVSLLQPPQPLPATQLMTLLINDLALTDRSDPVLLVLDDFHVIENQDIHHAVAFLLNNAPRNIHLALITRSDPALPLAQLRVRRQMTELRAAGLRLSAEETGIFLNQALGAALPPAQIDVLTERTEG